MDVVVNPPKPGEPSYESFTAQKSAILASLAEKAKLVADTFNSMEGFSCNTVQGDSNSFNNGIPLINFDVYICRSNVCFSKAPFTQ